MGDDADELERVRRRQEEHLNELITHDIREAWLRNTLIWIGVVGGSLLAVIGLMILVTGA